MGDRPRSRSPTSLDFYCSILGISRSATIKDMCKAYKSLVMKWHPDRNPSNKSEAQAKFQQINEAYKVLNEKKIKESTKSIDYEPTTPPPRDYSASSPSQKGAYHRQQSSMDDSFFSRPSVLLKSPSKKSRTPSPSPTYLSNKTSRRSVSPAPDTSRAKSTGRRCASETEIYSLTKSPTLRGSTPIIYSHSTVRRKPPPIERKLECSLEELCHGCIKKIKISRNVLIDGIIEQEEEIVKIKVQPGWKKGTKITFEGKGDEKPGYHPADLILVIDEKRHPLFKREGDDLEYGLEIPLVQALTGCSISVPLLGGDKMCLSFDEIIFPGFEKIIRGQGMPTKEEGKRGDLRIKFFVDFPIELSDEQRTQASSILQDCFS